jgi:hypothetical protein
MKRYAILAFAAFAFGLSGAQAGQVGEDTNAILHYEMMYTGYCDGFTLDVNTADGLAYGYQSSPCSTCPFTNLIGGTTSNVLGPLGITTTIGYDPSGDSGYQIIWTRLNANGTWAHYYFDGSVLNSGTMTPCSLGAVAPENAGPSFTRDMLSNQ